MLRKKSVGKHEYSYNDIDKIQITINVNKS